MFLSDLSLWHNLYYNTWDWPIYFYKYAFGSMQVVSDMHKLVYLLLNCGNYGCLYSFTVITVIDSATRLVNVLIKPNYFTFNLNIVIRLSLHAADLWIKRIERKYKHINGKIAKRLSLHYVPSTKLRVPWAPMCTRHFTTTVGTRNHPSRRVHRQAHQYHLCQSPYG